MARTYVAIVGLLALGVLFASLGAWQLRRAEASRATLAQFDERCGRGRARDVCRASSTTPSGFGASRSAASTSAAAVLARQHAARRRRRLSRADGAARRRPARARARESRLGAGRRRSARAARRRASAASAHASAGRLERLPRPGPAARRRRRERRLAGAGGRAAIPDGGRARRSGSASRSSTTSCCSTPPRPTATCASGARPASRPSGISAYAGQWLALAVGAVAAAVVMAFRTARRKP